MMLPSLTEFDALSRFDFNVFVERVFAELNGGTVYLDNFHIAVVCAELEAVRRGDTLRLAIALPPRSLKSIIVSVAYVAWLLGHNPALRIICASYGQQLSESLARDCRKVMMSAWYRRLFPQTRLTSSRAPAHDLQTTAGGYRFATSVGGSITGKGADYFIVDDPSKPEELRSDTARLSANEWARHTLFTRHDNKISGRIIIVMQRLHQDDMIGHVAGLTDLKVLAFAAIAQQDERYEVVTPHGMLRHVRAEGEALHPEREPLHVLEDLRRALGPIHFAAQYLQMPAPPSGNLINPAWFGSYDPTDLPTFDEIIQSWDTANRDSDRSDFCVCTTWGRKGTQLFLLHVLRKRLLFPALKRTVVQHAHLFNASRVVIEDCASGIALIQQLKEEGFYKVVAFKPQGTKRERLLTQTAIMEAGLVFLPAAASWREDYLHELMMFPASKYDDQVDSTSQALAWMAQSRGSIRGFFRMMEEADSLQRNKDAPDPTMLTVTFDYIVQNDEFKANTGRWIRRSADGYYHATEQEWQGFRSIPNIQRIDKANWE